MAPGFPEKDADPTAPREPEGLVRPTAPFTPAGTIAHYEILGKLGEGGMGVVYKARDRKLGRIVALKFLSPTLERNPELRTRFEHEARVAASLEHPNICTVYEIDDSSGRTFIAMAYIDGQDLAARIAQGPLGVSEAIDIGAQVGSALAAAHRRGAIHRDVKPANILVTEEGRAVLLDFGLAALVGRERLTDPKAVMGTVAYLAPEALSGQQPDARADLWALGVVLYEMLTGRLPFDSAYPQALLYSILNEPPPDPRELRDSVPDGLARVIERALAKQREERYQTADELLRDLKASASGAVPAPALTSAPIPSARRLASVAVLPFANRGRDADAEFLSDGLTEELIHALTRIGGLRVVSRTSAFQFKGDERDIREIGKALRVEALVEGSVRRAGERLRVTAQLVNVEDGCQIWSERYDRTVQDVFDLEDELTLAIVENLRVRLGSALEAPAERRAEMSFEAHELQLRGRFALNRQTETGLREAIDYFQRATQAAPEFAAPRLGLAECSTLLAWYGWRAPREAMPQAKENVARALAIDPSSSEAHCLLGVIHAGYDWDWEAARREFHQALALGSGFAAVHFHYALDYLTPQGRLKDALRQVRRAQALDPASPLLATAIGGCFMRLRERQAAIRQLETIVTASPEFYHAHWTLGRALEAAGDLERAAAAFEQAAMLSGESPAVLGDLGHCYGRLGRHAEARRLLSRIGAQTAGYVSPLTRGMIFLALGEIDPFFDALEQSLEQRSRTLVWLNVDSRFDEIRQQRRFADAVAAVGLPAAAPKESGGRSAEDD